MGIGALRELVAEKDAEIFGVPAVVTTPTGAPVTTTVIWMANLLEDQPVGGEISALDPRRVMSLLRSEVSEIPRGTVIVAAESGDVSRRWQVDKHLPARPGEFRVVVIPVT